MRLNPTLSTTFAAWSEASASPFSSALEIRNRNRTIARSMTTLWGAMLIHNPSAWHATAVWGTCARVPVAGPILQQASRARPAPCLLPLERRQEFLRAV